MAYGHKLEGASGPSQGENFEKNYCGTKTHILGRRDQRQSQHILCNCFNLTTMWESVEYVDWENDSGDSWTKMKVL